MLDKRKVASHTGRGFAVGTNTEDSEGAFLSALRVFFSPATPAIAVTVPCNHWFCPAYPLEGAAVIRLARDGIVAGIFYAVGIYRKQRNSVFAGGGVGVIVGKRRLLVLVIHGARQ